MDIKKEEHALNISFKKIKEALDFYEIDDQDYIKKCKNCVCFINNNIRLKENVQNIYNTLYKKSDEEFIKLWKIKEETSL